MQAWTFILCLLGQVLIDFYMYVVAGCANVLEYPVNSTISCDASNCTVTCKDGNVFYDGNITKTYSCDSNATWAQSVPSVGCLGDYAGETESITTPIAEITYYTTHFLSTDLSTQGSNSLGKVPLMKNRSIVDENKTGFIGIGTGCGGLLIILLIVLALIKSSKKKSASTRDKYNNSTGNVVQKEGDDIHDIECDGLKDNLLYISSEQPFKEEKEKDEGISTTAVDDGLQDNILYISSDQPVEVKKEQHANFTTKVVDEGLKDNLLYIPSDQPINKDISKAVHNKKDQNKYSTTASKVNESNLQPTSTSLTRKSEFQNKAFHLSNETISNKDNRNTYAVVNKHKQTDVYAVADKHKQTDVYSVVNKHKLTDVYAVVDKNKYI